MSPAFLWKIKLSSLSVYHKLLEHELIASFNELIGAMDKAPDEFALKWSSFFSVLSAEGHSDSFSEAVYIATIYDDNIFTRTAASGDTSSIPPLTMNAVAKDVSTLAHISQISPVAVIDAYPRKSEFGESPFDILPAWSCGSRDISVESLADFHAANGCGEYAKYIAFVRRNGRSIPIPKPDHIELSSLKGYEKIRQPVVDNTIAFIEGLPANNCLLYGDRGTGKSSTVKALLNEYYTKGLRLIELPKAYLNEYPDIVQEIAGLPLKFIIFIDDLSFQSGDESYAALKGILEGGIASRPSNAIIYATTNRRHMLNETFSARKGDDLHPSDTIQESLSLSDRFGVQVTFLAPDRADYYRIIHALAAERRFNVDQVELEMAAEKWAIHKGGRSPRTAVQFIDDAEARIARGLTL